MGISVSSLHAQPFVFGSNYRSHLGVAEYVAYEHPYASCVQCPYVNTIINSNVFVLMTLVE